MTEPTTTQQPARAARLAAAARAVTEPVSRLTATFDRATLTRLHNHATAAADNAPAGWGALVDMLHTAATEPTTTQPAETPEQTVADGWCKHPDPVSTLTGDLLDRINTAEAALEHLTAEYRRVVDDLDVCRAARDRYQRATSRLRTGTPSPATVRRGAQTAPDAPAPSGPDLSQVIADRIADADLAGPADTKLARATIAVDTYLDELLASMGAAGYCYDDINREDLAKVVLHALDEPEPDPDKLIADTEQDLASCLDDEERADIIAELLDGWYAAWPDSAVTDPHQPLAQQLVRLLGGPAGDQDDPDTILIDPQGGTR